MSLVLLHFALCKFNLIYVSDADVEDNVESDMSRLDLSVTHSGAARPSTDVLENLMAENSHLVDHLTASSSIGQSMTCVSLEDGVSCTVVTEISNMEYTDAGQEWSKDDIQRVYDGCTEDNTTSSFHEKSVDNITKPSAAERSFATFVNISAFNDIESSVDKLCNGVEQLSASEINDVDKPAIYCEVAVNNAQVAQLSDSLDRLAINGDDLCEDSKFNTSKPCSDEILPQVSVTFNISLEGQDPVEDACITEELVHTNSSSSHIEHKVESEKGEVEEHIVLTEERQHERQNILKTHQENLREARNYSMSTLSPRYVSFRLFFKKPFFFFFRSIS